MKKRYILTFLIPMILAALIALAMTPDVAKTLSSKLSKFDKSSCYYEVKISYTGDGAQKERQKISQYKDGDKYFAQYYINRDVPLLVNVSGNEVKFGTAHITSSVPVNKLKAQHNVFMMDKLTAEDINKDSVKRDRSTDEDKYLAKLNDGTNIVVVFDNRGKLSRIEYKNLQFTTNLINSDKKLGSVTIEILNLDNAADLDKSFILPSNAIKVSYDEINKSIETDSFEYDGAEDAFADLKRVFNKDGGDMLPEDGYASDEEYEAEDTFESNIEETVEDNFDEPSPENLNEDFSGVEESNGPVIHFEELENQPEDGFEPEVPPDFEG